MKKKILLLLLLLPLVATAQVKFGYIRYNEVCRQMPQYAEAQTQLADLKSKYDKEAERGETEFQRKYADFLQGQKDFPSNILLKRQAELQDLMERGIAFRKEAQDLLSKAEEDFLKEIYTQLNEAITEVAEEQGYAFVLNTDGNACPFINPTMGEDATDRVRFKLGIIKELPKVEEPTQTVEEPVLELTPDIPVESVTPAVPAPPATPATPETPETSEATATQDSHPTNP